VETDTSCPNAADVMRKTPASVSVNRINHQMVRVTVEPKSVVQYQPYTLEAE